MKILITGASGRLGQELAKVLVKNYELVALSRNSFPAPGGVKSYEGIDLADPSWVSKVAEIMTAEKPDVVIHLAALVPPESETNHQLTQQVNADATEKLAELASQSGVKKFIFASSSAVYNQLELSPTDENSNIGPQSNYGKSKLKAEQLLRKISSRSHTKFTALRIFNIYGEAFDNSLIYKLIHSKREQPLNILGPENYYRDYIHVSDVVEAFRKIVEDQQADGYLVMNIGSGETINNKDLIKVLEKKGIRPSYSTKECPLSVSWADITVAKIEIGFSPATDIIINR